MSAQIIKLTNTKQKIRCSKTKRLWVSAGRDLDLDNGIIATPLFDFDETNGVYSLRLRVKTRAMSFDMLPEFGKWMDLSIIAGLTIMPMAVHYSKSVEPDAVFFEFAAIAPDLKFLN